jgi:hypothetical protein
LHVSLVAFWWPFYGVLCFIFSFIFFPLIHSHLLSFSSSLPSPLPLLKPPMHPHPPPRHPIPSIDILPSDITQLNLHHPPLLHKKLPHIFQCKIIRTGPIRTEVKIVFEAVPFFKTQLGFVPAAVVAEEDAAAGFEGLVGWKVCVCVCVWMSGSE